MSIHVIITHKLKNNQQERIYIMKRYKQGLPMMENSQGDYCRYFDAEQTISKFIRLSADWEEIANLESDRYRAEREQSKILSWLAFAFGLSLSLLISLIFIIFKIL